MGLWGGESPAKLDRPGRLPRGQGQAPAGGGAAGSPISPLVYATRAHEILEDAQRDMLSGVDAPWSGAGLRATADSLAATEFVVGTLRPLLDGRDSTIEPVEIEMARFRATLDRVRREHGGAWPTPRSDDASASTSGSTGRSARCSSGSTRSPARSRSNAPSRCRRSPNRRQRGADERDQPTFLPEAGRRGRARRARRGLRARRRDHRATRAPPNRPKQRAQRVNAAELVDQARLRRRPPGGDPHPGRRLLRLRRPRLDRRRRAPNWSPRCRRSPRGPAN